MNSFAETGLLADIQSAVLELGFEKPTPIQAKTIPHLLTSDQDLIAFAQTGTGKTAAFGLPAIHLTNIADRTPQTLILCPTRELCIQITKDLTNYSKNLNGLSIVSVYGGSSIDKQITALNKGAHIVVGTPGRTKDLITRNKLKLGGVVRLVLDEADEMLTMGFKEELDAILEQTPEKKQTLLFSATMSKEIISITKRYMNNPIEISATQKNTVAVNVEHLYYMVHAKDRYEVLKRIADMNPNVYGIVFCRTRMETKEVANKLMGDGYNADALHGDLSQAQRDEVMNRFRLHHLQLLVATDVAARGLDVSDLTHIINYNLPDDAEIYIHRSGRTGRAGKSGTSIAIIHTRETRRISEIEKKFKITFTREPVPSGKDICTKQLYSLIDKIEKVEVEDKQIEPFMPAIYEKLEWLSREDLIKHFVSAEFNRFLEYYKNARDINVSESQREDRSGRREERSGRRGERSERSERRDERPGRRGERSERRDERPGRREERSGTKEKKSWEEKSQKSYTRLYINVGSKNDLTPVRLIGLINNGLDSGDAEIGKIEILRKFSFFEIEEQVGKPLIDALAGKDFDGVPLALEVSQERPDFADYQKSKPKQKSFRSPRSESRPKDKGRRSSGGSSSRGGSSSSGGERRNRKKY